MRPGPLKHLLVASAVALLVSASVSYFGLTLAQLTAGKGGDAGGDTGGMESGGDDGANVSGGSSTGGDVGSESDGGDDGASMRSDDGGAAALTTGSTGGDGGFGGAATGANGSSDACINAVNLAVTNLATCKPCLRDQCALGMSFSMAVSICKEQCVLPQTGGGGAGVATPGSSGVRGAAQSSAGPNLLGAPLSTFDPNTYAKTLQQMRASGEDQAKRAADQMKQSGNGSDGKLPGSTPSIAPSADHRGPFSEHPAFDDVRPLDESGDRPSLPEMDGAPTAYDNAIFQRYFATPTSDDTRAIPMPIVVETPVVMLEVAGKGLEILGQTLQKFSADARMSSLIEDAMQRLQQSASDPLTLEETIRGAASTISDALKHLAVAEPPKEPDYEHLLKTIAILIEQTFPKVESTLARHKLAVPKEATDAAADARTAVVSALKPCRAKDPSCGPAIDAALSAMDAYRSAIETVIATSPDGDAIQAEIEALLPDEQ